MRIDNKHFSKNSAKIILKVIKFSTVSCMEKFVRYRDLYIDTTPPARSPNQRLPLNQTQPNSPVLKFRSVPRKSRTFGCTPQPRNPSWFSGNRYWSLSLADSFRIKKQWCRLSPTSQLLWKLFSCHLPPSPQPWKYFYSEKMVEFVNFSSESIVKHY